MCRQIAFLFSVLTSCVMFGSSAADQSTAADEKSIYAVDQQYIQAFNKKNSAAAMDFFTEDAVYLTDDGRTLRGKAEIQQAFDEQFKESGDSTLKLNVYNVEIFQDHKHATERGVSIVTRDGIDEPSSYVADFVKQGDRWLVSKVTESPQAATTEKLQPLAWMIGDWVDDSEDTFIRTKTEWSLDRAFIVRRFAVIAPGRRELKGIEYIGWNPARQEITSWYFDSDGGYGNGVWRQEGNRWIDKTTGMTPAGEVASATHIYTPKDHNTFTLRAIGRQVGRDKLDDVAEVTVKRSNEDAGDAPRGQL